MLRGRAGRAADGGPGTRALAAAKAGAATAWAEALKRGRCAGVDLVKRPCAENRLQ